ncbi:unnamed protein product [Psylliodes chrysocephalus]|uniref:Peptidase S1 domain-containing protein n=1 Tax=Psylliodes chrysocephalus TaxID=3402493 RepID=A0A9P0G6I0_9CUCU|nr:unnamed protein product [Psylliodes chrysocephala]
MLRRHFEFIAVMMLLIITIVLIVVKYGLLKKVVVKNDYIPLKRVCKRPRTQDDDPCRTQTNALISLRIISPFSSNYCAGSLIAPKWVLSSAHCFKDLDNGPFFAIKSNDAYNKYLTTSLKPSKVQKVFIHPNYTKLDHQNDIALAKLKTGFRGPYIKLNTVKGTVPCEVVTMIGVGRTNLKFSFEKPPKPICVDVSMISIPHCSLQNTIPAELMEGKYCTTTGCYKGDSGGPLLCNDIQVGIVSTDVSVNKPVLHTKVDIYYESFIRPTIKSNPVVKHVNVKKKSIIKKKNNVKRKSNVKQKTVVL